MHKKYETVSEAINDLKSKGYSLDFNLVKDKDCLVCHKESLELDPNEFEIDTVFRIDSHSDPSDEMIVFAISSKVNQAKGILINAFGVYGDTSSNRMMSKLFPRESH